MKNSILLTTLVVAFSFSISSTVWAQTADLPSFQQRTILLSAVNKDLQQKEFSDALCQLQNVETIEMTGHLFTSLPPCISRFGRTLRDLRLSGNKLATLPDAIGSLVYLESLDLRGNAILTLPGKLFEAKKLKNLNLASNQIATLPDSISLASSLEFLDLSGNQLMVLPDSFANLTSLQILKLSGNKITKVPKVLPHLINLIELDLSGNGLLQPEQEVIRAIFKGTKVNVKY